MAARFKEGNAAKIHQNLPCILLLLVPFFYWMLFQMCLSFENSRMNTIGTGEIFSNLQLVTQEGSCDLLGCYLYLQNKFFLPWCYWGAVSAPWSSTSPTGGAGRCNVLLICDSLLFAGVPPHLSSWALVCQWIQLHCQFTVPCWEAAEGGNRHGDWFLSCLLMQVFISGVQLAGFCHLWIYPHLWTDISDDTGVSAGLVC